MMAFYIGMIMAGRFGKCQFGMILRDWDLCDMLWRILYI